MTVRTQLSRIQLAAMNNSSRDARIVDGRNSRNLAFSTSVLRKCLIRDWRAVFVARFIDKLGRYTRISLAREQINALDESRSPRLFIVPSISLGCPIAQKNRKRYTSQLSRQGKPYLQIACTPTILRVHSLASLSGATGSTITF